MPTTSSSPWAITNLVASALLVFTLLFLKGSFKRLSLAALAGILFVAAASLERGR